MAAPSRESTGRLVTDSTFTLPYAYPSSADYSIESQFDDVPGPYRRQRGTRAATTFGNSTREDYASYLRSIGGGGAPSRSGSQSAVPAAGCASGGSVTAISAGSTQIGTRAP